MSPPEVFETVDREQEAWYNFLFLWRLWGHC